ncbi:MAG: hypothetical protein Q8Q40_05065 [Methylococcaceae bacterium]|nr:hypothetical protein [Methylococcaceae bacterium]MDP3903325.1 hypothetical protein [Methylococcaceae bacterium]
MSQDVDASKSSNISKGQDVASVGLIGAWLTSIIGSYVTDTSMQKNLILGVPFFSVCITEVFKWFWGIIGPQNADKIKLRCLLKKKQKAIENELKNNNLSETHKKKLLKELEVVSLDRINSFNHKN